MKTKNLLPHSWRPYGWALFAICLPLCLLYRYGGERNFMITEIDPIFTITHENLKKLPFLIENRDEDTGGWTQSFLDEILYVGIMSGLLIIGFSKLKVEDERTAMIRLEALQWGIYANYMVLLLTIVLVYDGAFLHAMIYNMFTPLLIFILRFYWLLYAKPAIEARKERSLSL